MIDNLFESLHSYTTRVELALTASLIKGVTQYLPEENKTDSFKLPSENLTKCFD